MRALGILVLIIVGFGLLMAIWIYSTYNSLVNLDEQTNNAYAQVDVVLQRRFDLIPNLVETVKGYASHEAGVLEAVTQARSRVGSASSVSDKVDAQNQLTGALSRLLVVSENYPQLKANESFLKLQDDLS